MYEKIYRRKRLRASKTKMALSLQSSPSCALYHSLKNPSASSSLLKRTPISGGHTSIGPRSSKYRNRNGVVACFFNPLEEPILKEALKEPLAFAGGIFAGLLRLDLNEDPLKEWVTRTAEAAGIAEEEINAQGSKTQEEEVPEQINIE
ncbi:UPF0426 protein At1g28150, chloroplastic [Mangifera indica]|uniref:UPF0426 protein At1g28150, chloroplastic n=1 Tax=Mangifera indica TaxID=29780 RepID=UPI001CFC3472|nr:UPF0426 protein At1g28150, chloroplastic [Mangifera indica]